MPFVDIEAIRRAGYEVYKKYRDDEHAKKALLEMEHAINAVPQANVVTTDFHNSCMQYEISKRVAIERELEGLRDLMEFERDCEVWLE